MTESDVLFGYRLQLFALAEERGVSEACRLLGVHRSTYYRWKAQVDRHGLEMLRPRERRRPVMPNQLSVLVEQRIVAFALGHPGFGPRRIASALARPRWGGLIVSPNGVYKTLVRHGLNTRAKRLALVAGYRAPYQPPREPEPEPHVETSRPGELVGLDCFFVGRLHGTRGPVWQITAIDTYSSFAWADLVVTPPAGPTVEQTSALARAPYITVAELTGTAAQGRILLAAPIAQEEIETRFADQIEDREEISFDRGAMALRARRKRTLHAITLSEAPVALSPSAETARVFAAGLVAAGLDRLPWSKALKQWRDRVMFLRKAEGDSWPDLSDAALAADGENWLMPVLYDKISLKELSPGDLSDALMALLPWELRARLEREAPTHFEAPTGTMLAIDYEAEQGPTIAVRLQELFGLNTHPSIAKGKVPLVLELLSPAQRPVQVTRDLPGFWRGSYAAVRSDLRGRYPRHPWPEDPASAAPTRRVKPRGT